MKKRWGLGWILVAAIAAPGWADYGFTRSQIEFVIGVKNDKTGLREGGAIQKAQFFYHYFNKERSPDLKVPPWVDQQLGPMLSRPVWQDPDEGVLSEAKLWQAPFAELFTYFSATRKTFPPEFEGALTQPGALLKEYADTRIRFQMSIDRLYRARMGDSLGGRGRSVLSHLDLTLKQMDATVGAIVAADGRRYVQAVLGAGRLTHMTHEILWSEPRGLIKGKPEPEPAKGPAVFLAIAGLLLAFSALWSFGSSNDEAVRVWSRNYWARMQGITREFNRQFVQIKVQYLVAVPVLAGIGLGLLTWNPYGFAVIAGAGCYVGYNAPRWYLDQVRSRRGREVEAQLMDAMVLLSNALKSGLDIVQGFELVHRDLTPPISEEFGLIIKNYQLGTPFEKAMEGMLERVESRLLTYLVKAIIIQRAVGGNLTKLIDRIVDNIREEGKLEEKVGALTAQQKIQSIVVAIVPWMMLSVMFAFQPEEMAAFYFRPLGMAVLLGCAIWITVGMGMVRKMGDVRV